MTDTDPADIERRLAELAAYHVVLFLGAAVDVDSSAEVPAVIARGLSLLIEEATRRREEWLGAP